MEQHLEDVKRVLTLLLLKPGLSSEEVAVVLQADSSAVRKMMPGREIERMGKGGWEDACCCY
jgi:hypothetical protein